jgi:HEAT repeat protein
MNRLSLATCGAGLIFLAGCSGRSPAESESGTVAVNAQTVAVEIQGSQDAASDALGRIGAAAVPALVKALEDPNPGVKIEACRALAYMGSQGKEAVGALTRVLTDREENVRQEAARALGRIGEPYQPAIEALIEMMRGKK